MTEICDYFRLLYARVVKMHTVRSAEKLSKNRRSIGLVDAIMQLPDIVPEYQLLAPVVRGRKGTHAKLLEKAKKSGYVRVRIGRQHV